MFVFVIVETASLCRLLDFDCKGVLRKSADDYDDDDYFDDVFVEDDDSDVDDDDDDDEEDARPHVGSDVEWGASLLSAYWLRYGSKTHKGRTAVGRPDRQARPERSNHRQWKKNDRVRTAEREMHTRTKTTTEGQFVIDLLLGNGG